MQISVDLGFLTGEETAEMTQAHLATAKVVGEPFRQNKAYAFRDRELSKRIGKYGGTFLKYRLTPPPPEAYSLHRKLVGAFLVCIKLDAKIQCRDILEDAFRAYKF